MKVSFLAVAIFAFVAISTAVDEECVQRKLLGLALHWPNPTDCSSFYRCTNKSVKRHIVCPANKEYNAKNGRCAPLGRNLCKLSLKLALDEAISPCRNVLSGTFLPDAKSCRTFNICNNNLSYPQSCNAGSYFDTEKAACVPDNNLECWENLCLDKVDGVYLPNLEDCYSFYICSQEQPIPQVCPSDSFFDRDGVNCRPGACPYDDDTTVTPEDTTTSSTVTSDTSPSTESSESSPSTASSESSPTPTTTCTPATTCTTPTTCNDIVTKPTTTTCDYETTTAKDPEEECDKSCCDQTKCINEIDNILFPAKNNNKIYCMCLNQEAWCRQCPYDHVFIPSQGGCSHKHDTTTIEPTTTPCDDIITTTPCNDDDSKECAMTNCNQTKCVNAPDLTLFPSLSSDKYFCQCINHYAVCHQCPEGSEYLPDMGACFQLKPTTPHEEDTTTCMPTTPCPEEPKSDTNKCNGDIEEGEFVGNPNSCKLFFICFDGELIESSCGLGNYFNENTKNCKPDTQQICPDSLHTPHTNSRSKRSITKLPTDADNDCCPGGLHNGDAVPHPTDCDKKLVCCNGEMKEESCGKGYFFNATLKECAKDVNNVCWPNPECVDGQVKEHPSDCSMYLACCHGIYKEMNCEEGYYFNPTVQKCIKDINNTCKPTEKTCEGGHEEGQIVANPGNCSTYFKCTHGQLKPQYCGYGYYFSPTQRECVQDYHHICWPEITPSCPGNMKDGEKVENPADCAAYLICSTGQLHEVSCGPNMYYNKTHKECLPDINNVCWPREPTCDGGLEEGDKVSNPQNCSSYLRCCHGEFMEEYCGYGMIFNSTLDQCVEDKKNVCWPKEPTCVEGEKRPNPDDCASYIMCINDQLVTVACGYGMRYDKSQGKCVADTTNVCWPKEPTCKEGDKRPNPSDCATYLQCKHDKYEVVSCGYGMMYNSTSKKCVIDSNNVCWPKEPTCECGIKEGEMVPNPDNCCGYLICCHGMLKEESCGKNMIFSSSQGRCVPDVNNVCWPKEPTCDYGLEEGDKVPNPQNCSSYLRCCHGELMEEYCGYGMIFNSTLDQCVEDKKNVCWPKEPTCVEGEKRPNPDDCASYIVCINDQLVTVACGYGMRYDKSQGKCVADTTNVCWPKEPTCKEGDKRPNPSDCATYLQCKHDKYEVVSCGYGMMYNSTSKKCVIDSNNVCWPKEPTCECGIKEGEMVPNPDNCCGYLICCHGMLKEESCGKNMIFSSSQGRCVPDVNNVCWPKEPTCDYGLEEGDKVPNPQNCSSYLRCCHGELMEEYCGYGMIFNSTLDQCVEDKKNVCWPKEPTCVEGEKRPNPDDCASYIMCINDKLVIVACGYGMRYDKSQGKCVADTTNVCWPKEPTCKEGEKRPNPSDCATYLQCKHDKYEVVSCGYGMMYNSTSKKCVIDSNNVCWPKEPTCECGIKEGEMVPNPDNCCGYLICCHGMLKEESCGKNMIFSSSQGRCVPDVNNVCWPKAPTCDYGLQEGEKVPNPQNCSSYLRCCHGELMEEYCGYGMIFNSTLDQCVEDKKNVCWPKEPTCVEGEKRPNPDDCASYIVCINDQLVTVACGYGMRYDKSQGKCVADTTNVCWPKEPTCKEGDKRPNPSDCATYLQCKHDKYEVVSCGYGMMYNSTSKKCVIDSNNVCWPKEPTCECGIKEGEMVPNPDNCCGYLICCHGMLKEESCGKNMIFSSSQGRCVPDVNNVCWPKEPTCDYGLQEGEKVPNPQNCSSYLRCCHGELMEEYCGYGMIFNSTLDQCVEDKKNVCWPKEPTCVEGEKRPNPDDCASYIMCINDKLVTVACGYGMRYDKSQGKCVPDTTNVCWPKEPTCKEGDKRPNPSDCATYLQCKHDKYEVVSCGYGMMFNSISKKCVIDSNNVCWPKEPTCECGIKEGEMVPNPDNCCGYLICCHGMLKEESCGKNMIFSSSQGRCVPDVNNVCWPREPSCDGGLEEGDKIPNPKNCSSYLRCCHGELMEEYCGYGMRFDKQKRECVKDVNNVCWPKDTCEEGEVEENPRNCSSYLTCCGGTYKEEFCGQGYYFNPRSKKCTFDVNNICWPKPVLCTCEGQAEEIEGECDKMAVCTNGQWHIKSCGKGNFFNPITKKCEPDTLNICWPKEPCTCAGGYKEGEKSPAADCDKYYTCRGGIQILGDCGVNMYFNKECKTCVPDEDHTCWPNYCAGRPNGTMVQKPKKCNAFYYCINEKQTEGVCETGQWYDPKQASCQPDLEAVCYNPCACQNQIKMLPHPDCRKFYFCNGNQTIVETCPVGGFDPSIGDCNPNKKCAESVCEDKPDYVTYDYPKDKTKFYVCIKGVAILKSCLPNTEYNGVVCAHKSSSDCDPKPCKSFDFLTPFATLNRTEKNAFCICRKGYATKQYCAEDYEFNAEKGACQTDAPCDPMLCRSSNDYTVAINRNDTKSFCMCSDNKVIIVPCPGNGTFNSFQLVCTSNEISTQCDQFECMDRRDYHTYPDSTGSTEGFCMCKGNIGVFRKCPIDTTFDVKMGVCRIQNIQCDSTKCRGQPNYTKIPALISTQGYCECVKDEAKYYNCDNGGEFDAATQTCKSPLCSPDRCINADDYTRFAAVGSTHGFCMCLNHEVTYKSCEEGGVFNTAMLICQMPLKNCADTVCKGVADNTKLPADYSIYGYCSCKGGKPTYQECPNGHIFDATNKTCEKEDIPVEDVCDTTYCKDTSHAGKKYPSFNNIYGYCECSAAGPTFQYCPPGETFDQRSLACQPSVSNQCDLSLCCDATPNHGYPIPTKTGNSSFCYCTGPGSAMLINCPTDLYYNHRQKKCVATIEEGCTCPGGLHKNDVVPNPYDCTQYFICLAGSMHQKSCLPGQYFNAECKECQQDTLGICVKKDPCTCLGTYREGERVQHPYNEQKYYVCENQMLHERNCGTGRIFNKALQQCMREPRTSSHHQQKRSVDMDELHCLEGNKRSVPSNCSQYELCINHIWHLRSCQSFLYYNPEEKQCLEPRDDTVCAYAKVTSLPECSMANEGQLMDGRTCKHYFRCHESKWHLKFCGTDQYFNQKVVSCLPHYHGEYFKCDSLTNATEKEQEKTCQDMSMNAYTANCAMYLMCLGNQWWYNYCPLGMFFNRTLNFCVTDERMLCPYSKKSTKVVNIANLDESEGICPQEGLLRSSSWLCNRYYICINGTWQQQNCGSKDYFDFKRGQCSPNTDGICQLTAICVAQEKRIIPGNCSAYEQCSLQGQWIRLECPQGYMFDDILMECIMNFDDTICSSGGLRKVCHPKEFREVNINCTQFLYCLDDQWVRGSCLTGNMYSSEKKICVPHSHEDKCKPLDVSGLEKEINKTNLCLEKLDGYFVPDGMDCSRYYVCVKGKPTQEMQCPNGSFFDIQLSYCRPNDGSCHLPLTQECANVSEGSTVAHPNYCQAYYICSSLKGQQLVYCPDGLYFNNHTHQCSDDKNGVCTGPTMLTKCLNKTDGITFPHDLYCNVYYLCAKGRAIAMECPDNYTFNASLSQCTYDSDYKCLHVKLTLENQNLSCSNYSDGTFATDKHDCTRYYLCYRGQAQPKKCPVNTYFNATQLLCMPDNGQCSVFLNTNNTNHTSLTVNENVCEDQHGKIMPDSINCNNFYVCINKKVRLERCYSKFFFNATLNQCQQSANNNKTFMTQNDVNQSIYTSTTQECKLSSTSVQFMCKEYEVGYTIAEPGDCRNYTTCDENGTAKSQRCRNGESYDSLLGICRQNDGTCQMDSGQRVGECNQRHGQLTRDPSNCRKYFVCINGQKIAQSCANDEYFNTLNNSCTKDISNACPVESLNLDASDSPQNCKGLNEGIFYPYISDNCHSYFQCIKGVMKIQQCDNDLYFDPVTVKCIQNHTECVVPAKTEQRSSLFDEHDYEKLCFERDLEKPFVNFENKCHSFYTCHADNKVSHELCPLGMAYDGSVNSCNPEDHVICNKI